MTKELFNTEKKNRISIVVCLICSIAMITICSKSSFLYPLNDWVDSNCFFTVGKSMMNGLVVYRDLLEQKGPFLYFLHGLAWLISKDTFLGVYLIEIIAAFFFLFLSYKIAEELVEGISPAVIPIIGFITYTAKAFCHGDGAEELCLPFLAYAIWVYIRSVKERQDISNVQYFVIGIMAGCVFWTKFTQVGFYIGWFIMPAITLICQRRWKQLGKVIMSIVLGVMIATIPYVIYFGIHGAITDWIKVYIIDNIFTYSMNIQNDAIAGMKINLINGFKSIKLYNRYALIMGSLGLLWTLNKRFFRVGIHLLFTGAATIFFIYMGGRGYTYYSFVLCIFIPYGIALLYKILAVVLGKYEKTLFTKAAVAGTILLCVLGAYKITPNRYLMGVDQTELPQYQFKEIIEQVENPTLLNYGFLDGGFYTVCNIIPNCKAFCQLNIPLQEMYDLQNKYVNQGLCDFVVTRGTKHEFEKYECVAQSSFMFENIMFDYYLYQLKYI